MNNCTILQADSQGKSPTLNHPQEPESRNTVHPADGGLVRELQELQKVRETLITLPCNPRVKPIVAELSGILALAQDGGNIDVGRLKTLIHAAREVLR